MILNEKNVRTLTTWLAQNRVLLAVGTAFSLLLTAYLFSCSHQTTAVAIAIPDEVDYNFHIRPILSDNCFKCHGPDANKREANLRLDTEADAYAALKDNPKAHGIVPGDPLQSVVWQRITTKDTADLMPPVNSNLKLTGHQVALIEKWIRQGAKYKPHWAFIAPQLPKLPQVDDDEWPRNEIDHFTLAKMTEMGLKPNEEAQKERLLKRVSLDLTGLPPSLDLQKRFMADQSETAYEKVVDELLKSPHYGEKMAISWLDVARYADSHGYQDDGLRTMWPWRDWVIHAFNQNYGYDQFLTWQLAGDLLKGPNNTPPTKEMLLATGFNRNHKITQEGGVIDEEYRIEYVTDRTNTVGKTFLALTYECAKCHDHKYDPILQKDYYSAFAFFNQVPEKGLFGTIDASFADPPNMKISDQDVKDLLRFVNKKDTASVMVMVMKDRDTLRPTHILRRGNYDQPADEVTASMPKFIMPFDAKRYPQNRLGLARWMTDPKNPLTARVFVNRIWQEFFGRGIVKTVGDFGMQGELPSHPELLDWLAVDFRTHQWDIKRLVRQIVLSATYRQSGVISEDKRLKDPENVYLSHAPRLRLPAELVRDLVLASSGLLNPEIGGPSVKPYQPKGLWEVATSGRGSLARYVQDHGTALYRRGMYVFIKRTVPPPSMLLFDASNRDQCEVKRSRTNTPLQALAMLNDPMVLESARVLAEKLMLEKTTTDEKINKAFRLILCRTPREKELSVLQHYFADEKSAFTTTPKKAVNLLAIGETPPAHLADKATTAALMQTLLMIYNLEETIML
ncbi:PSD1 and planctomycete cytochrome C domain-containing protein [Spirosoma panaciterrae]|uniref:PSD1 and planctomycete cytochrome C domain-containing protein n=1 Tax=Spirosoma panaciterrae TaxID=496058 RepID=UPI00036854F4|nr:PSD1 and planctomycete cytochrome C domain-containing protein [Spirosoma panaciterrae]